MQVRTVALPIIGEVLVTRRKGMKNIRVRVDRHGTVRLSLPNRASIRHALKFVASNQHWLAKQQKAMSLEPADGISFGNNISLKLIYTNNRRVSSKYSAKKLTVHVPQSLSPAEQNKKVKTAMINALKTEAEIFLLKRTAELAKQHGYQYKSCLIRTLTSRWGSCSAKADIKLNVFLAQLPPNLVDYVILHELNHTKHLHHGPKFWADLQQICPDLAAAKKELKSWQPKLYTSYPIA